MNLLCCRAAGIVRVSVLVGAIFFLFTLAMCGGGGDSGPESEGGKVAVSGVVSMGSDAEPLASDYCRFVDSEGQTHDTDISASDGSYDLRISPGLQGLILCSPQALSDLNLTTFISTIGIGEGSTIANEAINPATTVTADIVRQEKSGDPLIRKTQLLDTIANGQDQELELIVTLAGRLYRAMLANEVNASLGNDRSDGGGDSDSDVGDSRDGGVGGEAGDGADFSPLPSARCTFVIGTDFDSARQISSAALADLVADGQLNRPDLAVLAETVFQGLAESSAEIQAAFEKYFPDGFGDTLSTLTDDEGQYFLPIPPNLEGYVRCMPEDQPNLVLGTYIAGRPNGTTLHDQDVTPATTVFSTLIAPRLEADQGHARENYLEDIDGLETLLVRQPDGTLTGFRLGTDTTPANGDVGLVAFSATALFNAFYKNDLDVDFSVVLADLVAKRRVDPSFLEDQGIPSGEVASVAEIVNESIETTSGALGSDFGTALSRGRLKIKVKDAGDGSFIPGAVVDVDSSLECQGCGSQTGADGVAELTLGGLTQTPASVTVRVSGVPGFADVSVHVPAVALVTLDVPVFMGTGAAPLVIATEPSDGAVDVPLTTEWVSITFDQPMEGGWRIAASVEWPLPGDSGVYWSSDRRVFFTSRVNPGIPLPSDTTLTFTLNPPPNEEPNFRSPADVDLETYTFSFTTGDGN